MKFPYGIADFEKLITQNYYIVRLGSYNISKLHREIS
jgi:hypothetical protein